MFENPIPYQMVKKSNIYLNGLLLFLVVFFCPRPGEGVDKILKVVREIEESMVEVPAGEFLMGTDRGDVNGRPAHTVYLDTYFISRYEVSNRQYRAFLSNTNNPHPFFWNDWHWNKDNYPVVGVSWDDAYNFCKWLAKITGVGWRLPTEAEWEKAASWVEKDKKKLMYPWGDNFDQKRVNIMAEDDGYERSAPVDSFAIGASPYGVYHLADNLSEWCQDWFENDYYTYTPSKNPMGAKKSDLKSVRGGDWKSEKLRIKNTFRKGDWPHLRYNYNGFRVVRLP